METSCPSPNPTFLGLEERQWGRGAEEGPGSSPELRAEPGACERILWRAWPQLTQPLLTQATGWGPQQKGSRLNLKNVPEGGIRPLGSGVEAELGGLRPWRGEPQLGEATVCAGWLGEGPSCLEAGRGIG